ncbi:MAG: PLD nuclease N-terminal domain-containing protein [Candidatus Promineifilaceae bacterium]|nr:PLD nuclease N-terminal domain-containing protein [Candidatus Promineifilaceae bacterium]
MKKNKSWTDLSPGQKLMAIVAGLIQIGLLVMALLDIAMRPGDEIRGTKWIWTGIAFINFVGPIAYFLFGRKRDAELLAPLPEE